jgi:hypothetical protein
MTNDDIVKQLHYLIGSRYVASVKAYIEELTGRARVVGPGDMTTLDIDPQRIRIVTDANGCIARFDFT